MKTIVIDSQLLSTFQECPEKFRLTFMECIRPTHPSSPLVKGDVLHTALEAYYLLLKKGLEEGGDRQEIHALGVESAILEGRAKAALNGINLDEAEEVLKTVSDYLEYYKFDDIEPIAIEEPFIINLYENPEDDLRILYAGKIDLVATASRYQWQPIPFDNKSSGRNATPSGRSNQFFGYCVALDTSMLVVNKIGFQKTLSARERFKRHPLEYPQEYRDRWVRNTIKTVYRLKWAWENDEWEENLTSCDKYSGCTYKAICECETPEAKEWKIQSEYIIGEKWDVTKALELKKDDPKRFLLAAKVEGLSGVGDSQGNDTVVGQS